DGPPGTVAVDSRDAVRAADPRSPARGVHVSLPRRGLADGSRGRSGDVERASHGRAPIEPADDGDDAVGGDCGPLLPGDEREGPPILRALAAESDGRARPAGPA